MTPVQRHRGEDIAILAKREEIYQKAKSLRPERWSGEIRDWQPVGKVKLNPDREKLTNID